MRLSATVVSGGADAGKGCKCPLVVMEMDDSNESQVTIDLVHRQWRVSASVQAYDGVLRHTTNVR